MASSTAESLTNSSVEYFLLEPATEGSGGGSRVRSGSSQPEILSPIPFRQGTATANSERVFFDDDDVDDDEESTLNRDALSEPLFPTTPRRRTGSSFREPPRPVELSGLNYLNLVTCLAHIGVWWGVAVWGLDGAVYTWWETTERNETLVTPATWNADYLWVPILVSELIFTIVQLLPNYRARPIVTTGTGYFFFYTVLLQITYTLLYSFGLFIFSFIAASLALVSLLSLMASQQNHGGLAERRSSRRRFRNTMEYCIFIFPFTLHAGWMILTTVGHFSLLFRRYSGDTGLQLGADIVALGVLLPVASFALNQSTGPDFVIPSVVVWAYIGIACRLSYPSDAMIQCYGPTIVEAVLIATYILIGFVGCSMIPYAVIFLVREFCTISVVELE